VMGDDDLDLLHVGHYRAMTTDVATGLSRATARLTASRCPAASCTTPAAEGPGTAPARRARHVDREVQAACRRGR
jgi:hypothetical protein